MCDEDIDRDYSPDEISAMYRESFKLAMSQHEKKRERDIREGKEQSEPFLDLVARYGVFVPEELPVGGISRQDDERLDTHEVMDKMFQNHVDISLRIEKKLKERARELGVDLGETFSDIAKLDGWDVSQSIEDREVGDGGK